MDEMVHAKEKTETAPDSEPEYIKKRWLRRLKRMIYMELGEQEIYEYTCTWCDGCDTRFRTFCRMHGSLLMVPGDKMGEMELGCHPHVTLQPSVIPGAGRGALAAEPLLSGLHYKPYHGQVSNRPDPNSQYLLQMRKPNKGRKYVDCEKLSNTNWLRFVKCSRSPRKQNLQAFQHKGQIFSRTVKNINAGTDLLVWYGPAYAKQLNIDPKRYHTLLCAHRLTRTLLQGCLQHEEEQAAGEASSALEPHPFTSTIVGLIVTVSLTERERFACAQCQYSSNYSTHLSRLKLTQIEEKPSACDICQYTCTQAEHFNTHKHTQTGVKPFASNICQYTCTQAGHFNTHKRTHTRGKPFACNICQYTCTQAGHFNTLK